VAATYLWRSELKGLRRMTVIGSFKKPFPLRYFQLTTQKKVTKNCQPQNVDQEYQS
jgi:hypothetical protein